MQQLEQLNSADLSEALQAAAGLVPLKTLRRNFLHYLFEQARLQTLFAGQVLFEANSYDKRHTYLLHGRVELRYKDGRIDYVNGGDTAFPLAHQLPRPCRAVAASDCSVLDLDSEQLDRCISWSQVADYLLTRISAERDYDEDVGWMQTVLSSNLFFKVPPVNVEQIFSRLTPMVVLKGDTIVRQSEIGDCCYFIKEGTAAVTRYEEDARGGRPLHVTDIGVGRCFGEDALVYETVRNANVTMTSDGVLMRLEKSDFLLLLKEPEVNQVGCLDSHAETKPILIDVRTEDEYGAGHLPEAANIPLQLLCLKKRLLTVDTPYVFYCDTGRRSRAAAHLLARDGFNTAALEGGLSGAGGLHDLVVGDGFILRNGQLVSRA